jgi:hypothetical protein
MLIAQTEELLDRLKTGTFDPAGVQYLEQTSAHDFHAHLESVYCCRFQERRLRDKWELGVARSLRFELTALSSKGSAFPIMLVVPVFRNCLFLTSEADVITGVSVATRLTVRPIRKPFRGLALALGRGFKLDRMLDGWHLKPLGRRTVKLTDEFLQKRGWRFDTLEQFRPKP